MGTKLSKTSYEYVTVMQSTHANDAQPPSGHRQFLRYPVLVLGAIIIVQTLVNAFLLRLSWVLWVDPTCPSCPIRISSTCGAAALPPVNSTHGALTPNLCDKSTVYPLDLPFDVQPLCVAPYPMDPWQPSTLSPSDIAIGLLTVDTYKFTRDEFVLHSWLNPVRAPLAYFTCTIARPAHLLQPCLRIPDTHDLYLSNINKTIIGLRELFYKHPTAKWYFLSSDDSFVNVHYLLKRLQRLDHTQAVFAGGSELNHERCAHTGQRITWFAGGPGLIASRGLMELIHDRLSDWIEGVWMRGQEGLARDVGDVAFACFVRDLNVNWTYLTGMNIAHPLSTDPWQQDAFIHPNTSKDWDPEALTWHYVSGDLFLQADVFFGLQMIDRLERNDQLHYLADYSRKLIVERYHQQRRSLLLINSTQRS